VALDRHHEALVNLPEIDHVTVASELLEPPCVAPKPVMDALEATNHFKDRRVLVILARRTNFSRRKNCFHDELIGSFKGLLVPEALLCLVFGV
jgi:hypothetical protein